MPKVFVSHAFDDKPFLDEFVEQILRLGCGLSIQEIFYSSGEDTGAPSGTTLMQCVRDEVSEASLVVAVVSPTFQTRPVCVAELGAAWAVAGKLFPLMTPGLSRSDLEGVLPSMVIKHVDDGAALDELAQEIRNRFPEAVDFKSWGKHKAKWLAMAPTLADRLKTPEVAAPEEVRGLESQVADLTDALQDGERERLELKSQLEKLAAIRPKEAVAQALLPADDLARFKQLVREASAALHQLSRPVREALRCHVINSDAMAWPDHMNQPSWHDEVRASFDAGELVGFGFDDHLLVPDYEYPDAEEAKGALKRLAGFLEQEAEEPLFDWFKAEYRLPLDLTKHAVWEELFGLPGGLA